jgi:predicted Zn-dependent peptidase
MNRKLFQKIVLIALVVLILLSLLVPAIFSQTSGAPQQEKLLNGLKIMMWPDRTSDKVAIRIRVHSGSAFDPQGKEGVMQLLADSIFPNQAAKDFFAEDLGGGLEVVSDYDMIEVNATAKPEHFLQMLETLAGAVSNPNLDKDQTIRLRDELMVKVAALESEPSYVADRAAARRLLGTFPYGRAEDGTTASLKTIDFADLADAKKRFLTADNATVAISGNFDRNLALRASRRFFGAWLKSDRKVPPTFREADHPDVAMLTVASPKAETAAFRISMRGSARSDSDLAASMLFTRILESRLKTRVPPQFAEKLVVRNEARTLRGVITVGFEGPAADFGPAGGPIEAHSKEIVGKAISDAVTESEFQAAMNQFKSAWSKRETPSIWLDVDTFRLPNADFYKKSFDTVTLADVNAFAAKLKKQSIATVLVSGAVK